MLSHLSKLLLLLISIFILAACTSKKQYNSQSYKKSNTYKKIKNQKIKNSKNMHRATMRSYVIRGIRYQPVKTFVGEEFTGIASWYGPNFHAKLTSNGEIYDMHAQTAASKTLPMNTMVKVYNEDNGKSTIVRINDRGPFIQGRIIDLSNKAAHDIDMVKKGTANIHLKVIGANGKIASTNTKSVSVKDNGHYYLQVGAFSKIEGAKSVKRDYASLLNASGKEVIIKQEQLGNNNRINKVLIAAFRSKEDANNFKEENSIQNAIIIEY